MCYWPEEDPKYDPNKSRVENYQYLHKSMVDYIESFRGRCSGGLDEAYIVFTDRKFKGAHLDWNYTEMLRDLIDQGLVKVPITDFDVVFVEWASGNLDNVPDSYKTYKALCDWDGKDASYIFHRIILDDTDYFDQEDEIKLSTRKIYFYNDSNREEYIPTPVMNVEQIPQQIEYGNHEAPNFIPWQEREHTAFWVTGVAE